MDSEGKYTASDLGRMIPEWVWFFNNYPSHNNNMPTEEKVIRVLKGLRAMGAIADDVSSRDVTP